ncbi:uncharacterized protein LOC110642673 [Hevea brasiliensis]|uniref:uncharacterized protein LOC110642673 n=1 Tax=Hevea brasiliensis TaxID=3981 RepID=UPI0025ECEFF9|nr:uncharacterized protein LOC110642673 [Hevea brasiliensis]
MEGSRSPIAVEVDNQYSQLGLVLPARRMQLLLEQVTQILPLIPQEPNTNNLQEANHHMPLTFDEFLKSLEEDKFREEYVPSYGYVETSKISLKRKRESQNLGDFENISTTSESNETILKILEESYNNLLNMSEVEHKEGTTKYDAELRRATEEFMKNSYDNLLNGVSESSKGSIEKDFDELLLKPIEKDFDELPSISGSIEKEIDELVLKSIEKDLNELPSLSGSIEKDIDELLLKSIEKDFDELLMKDLPSSLIIGGNFTESHNLCSSWEPHLKY